MSNPTGINQYTRNGAGALRKKTGTLYHGTPGVFNGQVKESGPREKTWATNSIKHAKQYSESQGSKVGRVLVVNPGKKGLNTLKSGGHGALTVASTRRMSVTGSLPKLRKPSRK